MALAHCFISWLCTQSNVVYTGTAFIWTDGLHTCLVSGDTTRYRYHIYIWQILGIHASGENILMKSLIINVDDLGLAPAINQAVIELAQLQRIHSTSFMSLGNIEPDDVKTLQKQSIEIGLHFDLKLNESSLSF